MMTMKEKLTKLLVLLHQAGVRVQAGDRLDVLADGTVTVNGLPTAARIVAKPAV